MLLQMTKDRKIITELKKAMELYWNIPKIRKIFKQKEKNVNLQNWLRVMIFEFREQVNNEFTIKR